MKNETASAAVANNDLKLAWTEPTLTTLSLSTNTLMNLGNGMDGGSATVPATLT
jgi:hypothetical protein